jgi:Activator of Hsp90 ATPase homolog 1-like protein
MDNQSFTTTFLVDQTPSEVFNAVNNPRGWWSEVIGGKTDELGAEFNYHFKEHHRCQLKIIEFIPNKKVVWYVLDNYFDFTQDKTEWTDTKISFEIAQQGKKTEVHFTHIGLVPHYECYNACSEGWNTYINGSLRNLITTGKGQPNVGDALTESERALS